MPPLSMPLWDSSSRSASPSAAIPLWLLAVYGFNESGAVQSASAIDGIIMTAVWIPIALAAISMVIMQVYPISDKHVTDINRQLDEISV
ncbi:xyloside transporter [Klebsiella pneumoniae]|nr:xyloside transporter [Klebsiella pneumoniae]